MEMSLGDFLAEAKRNPRFGTAKDDVTPWYNASGDCIEFQSVHEAYIADRIDDFLTIYRSAESKVPIGFQIKDVMALLQKTGAEGLKLEWGLRGDKLISVSALLFAAYEKSSPTIARRQGYAMATQALAGDNVRDQVLVS